jgi:hypothetical protein
MYFAPAGFYADMADLRRLPVTKEGNMRTRLLAPSAVHIVASTCLFALTALSLTACKEIGSGVRRRGRAHRHGRAAPARRACQRHGRVGRGPDHRKPSAIKPATAEPLSAPPPEPAKTYPPFDPKASASTIGVFVYPKKGQTTEQQHFDENECFAWAKTNTGIDPTAPAPAQPAAEPVAKGGTVKGAAKGAAAGALIGAAAGDAGKGAAVGAAAGGVAGRRAERRPKSQRRTTRSSEATAAEAQRQKKFADGFTACMDGRGYSLK